MSQATTLDELYFGWLCDRVDGVVNVCDYTELLKRLHQTPFVSIVKYDENRIEDGINLRWGFKPYFTQREEDWLMLDCSVLEIIVSIAESLAFSISKDTDECFWELIRNLDLFDITDEFFFNAQSFVDETMDRLVYRKYDYDGSGGGLFPLRDPKEDQRERQLWDQMGDYILENDPLYQ